MELRQYSQAVTTSGSAGSATGTGTLELPTHGYIEYIYIDYHASAPNTTDVTVAYSGTPPGGNILSKSNSTTDTLYWPRASCVTNAASAITDSHTRFVACGDLTITVGDCDALTNAVTVYVGVMS